MEQPDTIAGSGFMIAEAERRLVRVSVSATPDGLGSWLNRIEGMARRELRSKRMGDEKAALDQQASDAARRLFPSEGLGLGDLRHQAHLDHGYPSVNKPSIRA